MNKLGIILLFSFTFFIGSDLLSQPSLIYEGGKGGGYQSANFTATTFHYEGGKGQGYQSIQVNEAAYHLAGGSGQGYVALNFTEPDPPLFSGGSGQGYVLSNSIVENPFLYEGGMNSGYDGWVWKHTAYSIYTGGRDDGYDMQLKLEDFIWTGAVGTGWSVAGNWNVNVVPDISRPVIIPKDVPFYPFVNEGVFAIGKNPNSGLYECKSLWIQPGASLITRVNNYVENYGEIMIDGMMEVRNPSLNAFQNLDGGMIRILGAGTLMFKP